MNDSYVQVSAKLAHGRALLKIEEIKGRREREWNSRVIEEMARRGRARLWMPWLKPLSIDDAKQRIMEEHQSVHGRYSPAFIDWQKEERCERILALARTVMDDELVSPLVLLSSEDLEHIS